MSDPDPFDPGQDPIFGGPETIFDDPEVRAGYEEAAEAIAQVQGGMTIDPGLGPGEPPAPEVTGVEGVGSLGGLGGTGQELAGAPESSIDLDEARATLLEAQEAQRARDEELARIEREDTSEEPPFAGPAASLEQVVGTGPSQGTLERGTGFGQVPEYGGRFMRLRGARSGTGGGGPGGRLQSEVTIRPAGPYGPQIAEAAEQQALARGAEAANTAQFLRDQAALQQEQAARDAEHHNRLSELVNEHVETVRNKTAELSGFIDSMSRHNIDPNRFFNTRPAGARFGAAIAVAAGTMAQYLTPGAPNAALAIVNQAIERDIQAQMANLQNAQFTANARSNLLGQLRANFSSQQAALSALRAIKTQEAINQLNATKSRAGAQETMAQFAATEASLRQQLFTSLNEAFQREYEEKIKTDIRMSPSQLHRYVENRRRLARGEAPVEAPRSRRGPARGSGPAQGAVPQGYTPAFRVPTGNFALATTDAEGNPLPAPPGYVTHIQGGQRVYVREDDLEDADGEQTVQRILDQAGTRFGNGRVLIPSGADRGVTPEQFSDARELEAQFIEFIRPTIRELIDIIPRVSSSDTQASPLYRVGLQRREALLGAIQNLQGSVNAIGDSEAERLRAMIPAPDSFFDDAAVAALRELETLLTRRVRGAISGIGGQWQPDAPTEGDLNDLGARAIE